jgi:hypothetical protein
MDQSKKPSKKNPKKNTVSVNSPIFLERRGIPEIELDSSQQRFYFNYFDDEVKKKSNKKDHHDSLESALKKEKKDKKKTVRDSFAVGNSSVVSTSGIISSVSTVNHHSDILQQ